MKKTHLDFAVSEANNSTFVVKEMPERFRLSYNDLDDMQRDVESTLRSVASEGTLGSRGSYRRPRW